MRQYEQRRAQEGFHDHAFAREILAGIVGGEVSWPLHADATCSPHSVPIAIH